MRENTVKLSDNEKDRLDEARREMFGTEEVPYGVTIERLCGGVLPAE